MWIRALGLLIALLAAMPVGPGYVAHVAAAAEPPQRTGELVGSAAGATRLAGFSWHAIPGSEMDSVFLPDVDNQPWMNPGAWRAIQAGWSGAACTGSELVLWGGGHSNGNHNGLLGVTPQGKWRRITEPSPVWSREQCPDGTCPAITGPCDYGKCNTGPDGRPVSRHTYYLLGYRDGALYSVAGATAPSGAVGESPRVWRYEMAKGRWEPLPDTPAPLAHGSIVVVGRKLYHAGGWKGAGVLDLDTLTWEPRQGNYGGQTGMVYVPSLDRIYMLGNGRFEWTARESFGSEAANVVPRKPGDEILDARHLGLTYYAAEDVILAWNGGRALHVIDPRTHDVTQVRLPGDDPGPALKNGTFGRLSDCGGRIMLLNGADKPLYVLEKTSALQSAAAPLPERRAGAKALTSSEIRAARDGAALAAEEPENARKANREPDGAEKKVAAREKREAKDKEPRKKGRNAGRERTEPVGDNSQPDSRTDPYYPVPPGGSLAAFDAWVDGMCGARSSWDVLDVGPGHAIADAANVKVGKGDRLVIRLHAKKDDHGTLVLKKALCVEVVGVPDAQGRLPVVNGINMTRGFRGGSQNIVDGGLIVRRVHVRYGKNDCIGSPNDGRFLSVEDSVVEKCGHHGVITGRSPHFYFRSLRTTWRYADSHLLYIHRIARADLIDNVCEAPGWGHCLRSIARVSVMTGNRVSNVALDGSLPPEGINPMKPKRTYLGMHPLDAYGCAEGLIANNRITYYRKAGTNIPVPINIRYRPSFMGCELGEHDQNAWRLLDPTGEAFQDTATWQRIRAAGDAAKLTLTVRDNVIDVVGPDREDHQALGVQGGSLPLMGGEDRRALAEWLRNRRSATGGANEDWAAMRAAMPSARWKLIADLVVPEARARFLTGRLQNNMPLPIPVRDWFQRQTVRLGPQAVRVCDDDGECRPSTQPLLRPESVEFIYFGEPDPAKQYEGPTYRRARIEEVR